MEYTAPLSTANEALSPSLPNSDLFNLSSPEVVDSPIARGRTRTVKRCGVAHRSSPARFPSRPHRSSPLARFPPMTPESVAAAAAPLPRLTHKLLSDMTEILPQPSSGAAIGLGHPSVSKRRCAPLESDPAVSSPPKRARINSSIQCRAERFTTRTLGFLPVQAATDTPRPAPEARWRSYAQAATKER
ncbi:hypothetical protein C8R45DRAFT_1162259 [Mycena sanguinolenta]|nr:hypothetical protein C8R45DRAFT_1162259 [Mycena sanguinolenta]